MRRDDAPTDDPRDEDLPVEINMTDLEAAEEENDFGRRPSRGNGDDVHAFGTPLGGTASGGLAGTNIGHGDPDNADLEDALGSGIHDTGGEVDDDEPME